MRRTGTVIVGRGKVGSALAGALVSRGHAVRLIAGRTVSGAAVAAARVVVLAVSDAAVAETAERLAPGLGRGAVVLHCAGRFGVEPLGACVRAGAQVGVMHPLASFASKRCSPSFVGTTFVVAGGPRAVRAARALANVVGANTLVAQVHGAAYHASAAMLAGGSVALVSRAIDVLVVLGVKPPAARRALAGLLRSVAVNLEHLDASSALTGPVARGDAVAVVAHRVALAEWSPEALAVYDAIMPTVLEVAVHAGLDEARATEVARALGRGASPRRRVKRLP